MSEWDDTVDEKYQDALDMTPLPLILDLPLEDIVSHPKSHFDNQTFAILVVDSDPLDQPTGDRSSPLMHGSAGAHSAGWFTS